MRGQHRLERLGLGQRAREAVEDEAVARSPAASMRSRNDLDDDLVGDELAALHDRLGALADLGPGLDRRAQHVAGGELRYAVFLDQPLCLGPLARPRRPEQDQPHRRPLPPAQLRLLDQPLILVRKRWPWICATVSIVTLTTISSDVPPR